MQSWPHESNVVRRLTKAALADLLETHKDSLLDTWERRVLADPHVPSAIPLSRPALQDHFPGIIDRIVATLRNVGAHAADLGATVGTAQEAQHHVRDRVQADYSVPEVLRELSHLRLTILDFCERRGSVLDAGSGAILSAAFDHVMIHAADALSRLEIDARRRLEEANRTKDQFLAMVSHELRTPLNAIAGWSQMLERHEHDAAMRARAVASIQRNAKAQCHLIDGVLDITRLTSGRVTMSCEPVDVALIVRATIESFNPALSDKALSLEASLPESAAPVLGDEQRVRQVFTNLVGNAVKFTPRGGRIRVQMTADPAAVRVDVTDSGTGIAPAFLPHVFEPFRQADSTWSREYGGLGLGLAITRALVELHGGCIRAASEGEGRGATFTVTLPVAWDARTSESSSPTATRAIEPGRLCGVRALVVDDAPDAREVAAAMLESAGAYVEVAASGAEALEALRRRRPDVLVSDLAMPHMDGLHLIQSVERELGPVPAVAMSAFTAPQAVAEARSAGFLRHVAKPLVMADFVDAVAEAAAAIDTRRHAPTGRP
jgi:signal transduction histidine kinase/ActR/RegA family two-component response regulator